MENEVEVSCPYCGETGSVAVDEEGEFVQDCAVCCRPWRVRVRRRRDGSADVTVEGDA